MVELLNFLERWRLEVCMVERLNVDISAWVDSRMDFGFKKWMVG
jgi:hypothetical protein